MNETKADLTGTAKPSVAVVDDDESVREAIKSLLRSAGYCADAFDSAEEFLISGRPPKTHCLILDVKMPGMGGIALRERLAGINPPLPTVFITAHGDEATRRLALSLGAVDFLPKPFHDEALLVFIGPLLDMTAIQTRLLAFATQRDKIAFQVDQWRLLEFDFFQAVRYFESVQRGFVEFIH